MIITCEKCYAKFNLDENLLKQTGSKVRCSKCQNIFLAYPPTEMERPAEPAEEIVGFETIDSDVGTESVEQVEVPEEEAKAGLEIEEEEFDLADIEKMLDTEEKPEPEAEVKEEPEEVEPEMDAELIAKEASEKPELEFEDIDKEETKKEVAETVDLGAQADQLEAEEVEKPLEADVETEEAPTTTEQETAPAEKKRISTPVLIVLIIALLTGGAYGTYVVLKSMNIKIPFISDLIEPAVQDEAGNLKIIAFDITDKFIDNSKVGKLFIISGKVKNEYSGARSFIRITGKLYAKERVLSKTATVYCGNVLSDQDLSNMDINSINKKLSNLLGNNKSNVNVKPGKLLQFMIVFSNIPDNIEEYTVEVMGSSPA